MVACEEDAPVTLYYKASSLNTFSLLKAVPWAKAEQP